VPGRDARDGGRYGRLAGVERDGLHADARLAAGRGRGRGDGPEVGVDAVPGYDQDQNDRGPDDGSGPEPSGIGRHTIRPYR
jgi:hypothetical protein